MEHEKIDPAVAFAMIFFGAFIDALQFILTLFAIGLFIGPALSALAALVFWWFFPKPGTSTALVGIFELIPVFDMFPMWTAYAIRIIVRDRLSDTGTMQKVGGNPNQNTLWQGPSARRNINSQAARQPRPGFGGSTMISSGPGPRPQQPMERPTPKPNRVRL